MTRLYETENNKGLIIYPYNNQIVLREKNGHLFEPPIILAEDYDKSLADFTFNNILYFSYINLDGNLCIKSIIPQIFPCTITRDEQWDFDNYQSLVANGQLLILYITRSLENNNYRLRAILPLQNQKKIDLMDKIYVQRPTFIASNINQDIIICVDEGDNPQLLVLHKDFSTEEIIQKSKENDILIQRLNDEISSKNTLLNKKNDEIKKLNNMIASATSQYNELKIIAEKYREEAIKWNRKFM